MYYKYEKLFDLLIDEKTVTSKKLSLLGYKPYQITGLVKKGILKRVRRGEYEIASIDIFEEYANYLEMNGKTYSAATLRKIYGFTEILLNKSDKVIENSTEMVDLNKVIESVLNSDFSKIPEFLKAISKADYLALINNLIKLSNVKRDMAYQDVIFTLIDLDKGNYKFNYDEYLKLFRKSLNDGQYEEARVYLDIISSAKNIGISCDIEKYLRMMLDIVSGNDLKNMEPHNLTNEVVDNTVFEEIIDNFGSNSKASDVQKETMEPIEVSFDDIEKDDEGTFDVEIGEDIKDSNSVNKNVVTDYLENEIIDENLEISDYIRNHPEFEYINKKVDELYDGKSVVVLEPMDFSRIQSIHNLVYEYRDVVSFSIGSGDCKRVVLRFRPENQERIDFTEVLKASKRKYLAGDYAGALSGYRTILETGRPRCFVYAYAGVCLSKLKQEEEAIDCLMVADELGKIEGYDYDFSNYIMKLKETLEPDNDKVSFLVKEDDFYDKKAFGYIVDNLDKLEEMVKNNNMPLEVAITELGFDESSSNLVRLIYARDCYYLENYAEGDNILRKVMTCKNKDDRIKNVLAELSRGKKFYKNRLDEKRKCLVFKR